jgi:hypothetical protein
MSNFWTRAQSDAAFIMWRDGERAAVIGERIGKTRNAVIGRADRCGFGRHPCPHDLRQKA